MWRTLGHISIDRGHVYAQGAGMELRSRGRLHVYPFSVTEPVQESFFSRNWRTTLYFPLFSRELLSTTSLFFRTWSFT